MTAIVTVVCITVLGLAVIGFDFLLHMRLIDKVADRMRIVNPVKQPEPQKDRGTDAEAAGADNERALRPAS